MGVIELPDSVKKQLSFNGSGDLARDEEIRSKFEELRSGLNLIPGVAPLQLVMLERLNLLTVALGDYEVLIREGQTLSMNLHDYNEAMKVFNSLSKSLFDGTAKCINRVTLERLFVEKVMSIVADELGPEAAARLQRRFKEEF